jgi:hypothetical protein
MYPYSLNIYNHNYINEIALSPLIACWGERCFEDLRWGHSTLHPR